MLVLRKIYTETGRHYRVNVDILKSWISKRAHLTSYRHED